MRRVIGLLALVAVGSLGVDLSAQQSRVGTITVVEQVTDGPDCSQLAELRHQLLRLHQELRRLKEDLKQAHQAGNRERAKQIMQDIRQVEAQIDAVQHKIRRLKTACG